MIPYLHKYFYSGAENTLFALFWCQFSIITKKIIKELHLLTVLFGTNLVNICAKKLKKNNIQCTISIFLLKTKTMVMHIFIWAKDLLFRQIAILMTKINVFKKIDKRFVLVAYNNILKEVVIYRTTQNLVVI